MKNIDNQFVQIPFKVYQDEKLFKKIKNCLLLYEYLQYRVWRGEHDADKYNLYNDYFKKGLLASAVSIKTLANILGRKENTIRKQRGLLKEYGFIKTKYCTITIRNKEGVLVTAKPYIYILGKHIKGKPLYYASDV